MEREAGVARAISRRTRTASLHWTEYGIEAAGLCLFMMSACLVRAGMSLLREWHTVTVALAPLAFCIRMRASGLPTMFERPTMTTCLPSMSMLLRMSSCCTPNGVHG